jgi:hypothetical protein
MAKLILPSQLPLIVVAYKMESYILDPQPILGMIMNEE